jgi:hypothetical protein
MTLPENVMKDLLSLVLAGEASPETRTLVEEYAGAHPEFARLLREEGAPRLRLQASPSPDLEMKTLERTKKMFRLQWILMALTIVLVLASIQLRFGDPASPRFQWGLFGYPPIVRQVLSLAAAAFSVAFLFVALRAKRARL